MVMSSSLRPREREASGAVNYEQSQAAESSTDNRITNANVENRGGIPRDRDTGAYVGPFSSAYEHSEALAGDMGPNAAFTASQATHSSGLRGLGGLDRDTSIFGKNAGIGSLVGMDSQYSDAMLNPLVGYKPQSVLRSEALAEQQRKASQAALFKDGIPNVLDLFKNILSSSGDVIKQVPDFLKGAYGDFRMGLEGFSFDPENQKSNLMDPEAKKSLGFEELSSKQYEEKVDDFISRSKDTALRNKFNKMISGRSAKPEPLLPNAFEDVEDPVVEDPSDEGIYPDDLMVAPPVEEVTLSPYTQVAMGDAPTVRPFQPLLPPNQRRPGEVMPYNIDIFDTA